MGRKPIQDQFSRLKISAQRKSQLRLRARGLCYVCKRPLPRKK